MTAKKESPTPKKNVEQAELKISIEKQLIDDLKTMANNSGKSVEELVEVSIKRFRSSHADYMGIKLDFP